MERRIVQELSDFQGRKFKYLRLSLTDICNFSCTYCLPNGFKKSSCEINFLTRQEITNLVTAFAALGVEKIRLTGGEPTLRTDIVDICRDLADIPGIKKLALTTNGYRLIHIIPQLRSAGLNSINISIDSLNAKTFKKITGKDKLEIVLAGLTAAKASKISPVKVNTVLLKDLNCHELPLFFDFVKSQTITLRFIELMRTGQNFQYFERHHLSTDVIKRQLLEKGWVPTTKPIDSGPAQDFWHKNYAGKIGLIAPYSQNFCQGCNRLRITSRGGLKLCLFGDGQVNLRPLLASPAQKDELIDQICQSLKLKPERHYLHELKFGDTYNLSTLGG